MQRIYSRNESNQHENSQSKLVTALRRQLEIHEI